MAGECPRFFWTSPTDGLPIFTVVGILRFARLETTSSSGRGIWEFFVEMLTRRVTQCGIVAAMAGVVSSLAGCAEKRQTEWTPKPHVDWTHIASGPIAPPDNEYRIELLEPTVGLFPANMAVTRVSLQPDDAGAATTEPRLFADPRNEFLQWNSTFDDQMAVSEVFPIDQRDLGGGKAMPEQIVAAFRALHARLGLIYAVNELSEDESAMFGALYDISADRVIATFHAQAVSVDLPDDAQEKDDPYHLWKTDSRALVRAEFADMVHTCMRELILNDRPAQLESTKGWTPTGPIRPVEWPPKKRSRSRG